MKKLRLLLALTALAGLVIVSCGGDEPERTDVPENAAADKMSISAKEPGSSSASTGSSLNDITFTARDLTGQPHSSDEWIGKKPVVVNFWGSWCGHCRRETPDLVKLYDEYKEKGVEILGLAINDTPQKARAFADQYGMDWVLLMTDMSVAMDFGVRGAPTTFFFDARGNLVQVEDYNGNMVDRFVGARDYETLKRGFEAVLRQSKS